jgi:hypothetical protein
MALPIAKLFDSKGENYLAQKQGMAVSELKSRSCGGGDTRRAVGLLAKLANIFCG